MLAINLEVRCQQRAHFCPSVIVGCQERLFKYKVARGSDIGKCLKVYVSQSVTPHLDLYK